MVLGLGLEARGGASVLFDGEGEARARRRSAERTAAAAEQVALLLRCAKTPFRDEHSSPQKRHRVADADADVDIDVGAGCFCMEARCACARSPPLPGVRARRSP